MPIRAVVVDDDAANRALIRMVFESDERVDIVGEAADGLSGIKLTAAENPDVVILDLDMPIMDGLTVIPELTDLAPDTKILVFSASDEVYRAHALGLGAHDFVQKGTDVSELSDRIIDLTS